MGGFSPPQLHGRTALPMNDRMGPVRLLLSGLLAAVLLSAVPAQADGSGDRLIVRVRGDAPPTVGTVEHKLMDGMWTVRVAKGRGAATVDRLRGQAGVAWAEPDRRISLAAIPSDPCYDPPSSSVCGSTEQWGLANVGAPEAWDVTRGSTSVVVAVLDTGVQATHPDLAGKVVVGSNFSGSPYADDRHGHGTHVAGTVAAATDNERGVAGLGWNTKVRAIKVLDDTGSGFVSDVVRGINEAVATGAKVVNLSLADTHPSAALDQAVQVARQAGLVVVAAAGNDSIPRTTRNYPAAIDGVIGVAATDRNDSLGTFSNRGSWVAMAAPGVGIVSTCTTTAGNQCRSTTGYAIFSGTSMATPHVSAAAALLFAANPGIGGDQVRSRLASTARPIAGTGTDFQWGRLDVAAALQGTGPGYWLAARDGGLFNFGAAGFYGSAGGSGLAAPVVGMSGSPTRHGYWLVTSAGQVLSYGDARNYGGTDGLRLNAPILGMESTPSGSGYWLVAADGGLFTFGQAAFHGSTGGMPLNQPVVAMAAAPSGGGYWMVARDGGVFTFGDARFLGSMGGKPLNQPMVGMAATPSGNGYWMVARDGGIFTFGDARFLGSMGGKPLNQPIIGIRPTASGNGYWMVASDGGIFAFGDAAFLGSTGGMALNAPIVGMG
jgi:subtilisin family serine protease